MKPLNILLAANTLLLAVATIATAHLMVESINLRGMIKEGLHRLGSVGRKPIIRKSMTRNAASIAVKMTWLEKIEISLIYKSNIRKYLPFINIYVLAAVCLVIFTAAFEPVYRVIYFVPSTVIICILISLSPLIVLDLMSKYNSEKIRRRLADFIAVVNRWCAVKEDIFYAFEKSLDSGIIAPLDVFIRDMVTQVKRGVDPLEALDILQMKVDNPSFRDFIANIKQNIKSRGDIRGLLTNLEEQFYRLEEEYNRRRISTFSDRVILYCVMLFVLWIAYYFIRFDPGVEQFYLGTLEGKCLLTLFCMLYLGGAFLTFRVTKFDY